MDRNTITGFVLIGAVLVGFSYFSRPSKEEQQAAAHQDSIWRAEQALQHKADSLNAIKAMAAKAESDSLRSSDSTTLFFDQVALRTENKSKAKDVVLKNKNVEVTLNTLGGTVNKVRMLGDYKTWDKKGQVQMLTPGQNEMVLVFDGKQGAISSNEYYWEAVNQTDSTVTMRLNAPKGGTLDLNYHLRGDSYMTDFEVVATGMTEYLNATANKMRVVWSDSCRQQEKGRNFEARYATLTYKEKDDDTDYLTATGTATEEPKAALDWVAFKNQFFSCVLIGQQDFTKAHLESSMIADEKSPILKTYAADMQTFFDPAGKKATKMQLYLGPNDFHLLKDHNALSTGDKDLELEELVYLGWPLFKWINRFFILYIFDWLRGMGLHMGLVLLLLTVIIKILVFPPTRKSFLSSARMRVLKPKIDALSQKYPNKDDAMRKNQEMMQLYKEYGVSPMGGCLPMLIQMPVWVALFNFVPNAIQLRGESFLWADDLSAYDELLSWNTDLPLIGDHLSIFCLLFCATNIINTVISMRQQQNQMSSEQAGQMKMMRWMMYLMPVMFFFMFNNYSSGLCYYYFLSGLTSILIMWYLRKSTDDKKLLAQLEAYREQHKNDPKKMSGLQARLEAMQKQQEMMRRMKEQQKK